MRPSLSGVNTAFSSLNLPYSLGSVHQPRLRVDGILTLGPLAETLLCLTGFDSVEPGPTAAET